MGLVAIDGAGKVDTDMNCSCVQANDGAKGNNDVVQHPDHVPHKKTCFSILDPEYSRMTFVLMRKLIAGHGSQTVLTGMVVHVDVYVLVVVAVVDSMDDI
jgi:hypothetical protein